VLYLTCKRRVLLSSARVPVRRWVVAKGASKFSPHFFLAFANSRPRSVLRRSFTFTPIFPLLVSRFPTSCNSSEMYSRGQGFLRDLFFCLPPSPAQQERHFDMLVKDLVVFFFVFWAPLPITTSSLFPFFPAITQLKKPPVVTS